MKKEFNLMYDGAIVCAVVLAAGSIIAAVGMMLNYKILGLVGLLAVIAGFLFICGMMVFCNPKK